MFGKAKIKVKFNNIHNAIALRTFVLFIRCFDVYASTKGLLINKKANTMPTYNPACCKLTTNSFM